MKTPRNERTAHTALHQTADRRSCERAEWQRILMARDIGRDHRRAVRSTIQRSGALVTLVGYACAAAAMATVAACQSFI